MIRCGACIYYSSCGDYNAGLNKAAATALLARILGLARPLEVDLDGPVCPVAEDPAEQLASPHTASAAEDPAEQFASPHTAASSAGAAAAVQRSPLVIDLD